MISASHVRMMSDYNRWQNESIFGAADQLDAAARDQNRGGFWGSIQGTLSHLLWGDGMWMSRFDGDPPPEVGMSESPVWMADWDVLTAARLQMDDRIEAWAKGQDDIADDDTISFYSGLLGRDVTKSHALCVTHFFNHQTHHRGQAHAMLTAAGARPGDTDLFVMPDRG